MSIDEQDAATGRIVRESSECRKALAILSEEVSRAAERYREVGHILEEIGSGGVVADIPGASHVPAEDRLRRAVEQLPTPEKVLSVTQQLIGQRKRQRDIEKKLKDLGV